jgi:hypothetical protein
MATIDPAKCENGHVVEPVCDDYATSPTITVGYADESNGLLCNGSVTFAYNADGRLLGTTSPRV